MKALCRIALGAMLTSVLAGCGWFDRGGEGFLLIPKDDYLDSVQHNELLIPDDLRTLEDTDPFPIPQTPQAANPTFYAERPPLPDAIYANDNRDEVRIQRLGERRWLVIPEAPTTVWPKLKQFLAENGVPQAYDAPQSGRLNTGWLKLDQPQYRDVIRTLLQDAKAEKEYGLGQDRFLLKVEQGLRPLTSELHVRHENDSLSLPVRDDIVALRGVASHIAAAEDDMLKEVGAYIAAKVSEQTVSKVALQIGSSRKSELDRDERGYPILRLYLDYDRAWATLGQAMDNAELEVTSLDRDSGTFQVVIPSSVFSGDEGGGFFCRFTFSCDRETSYDLQLRVYGASDDYRVSVLNASGSAPVDADLAQQVLVMLREFAA